MTVCETVLRPGRRGERLRPFSRDAGLSARACSLRLQRVMADFGAESSFRQAVSRVREHYRIDVSRHALYTRTLRHGRAMGGFEPSTKPPQALTLLTQIDGSMIPVMEPGTGADKRRGKTLKRGEVRLCSARVPGSSQPVYGAGRGTSRTIGLTWEHTARQAGLSPQTQVHGLGDGAPWIADQFRNIFGDQGTFLIDFHHVSEYLAQVSTVIKNTPARARRWRRCQQGRLLNGHRHVIQQRLKLAGAWWKESHVQPMLNLRIHRANNHWDQYWQTLQNRPSLPNAPVRAFPPVAGFS